MEPTPFRPAAKRATPTREARTEPPRRVLIVPGLDGSGPTHWQSHWERVLPNCERVEQAQWGQPDLSAWSVRLAEAIERNPGAVLVAHSLGCPLVAHVAARHPELSIGAALLVAPADLECDSPVDGRLRRFPPPPRQTLPFPSLVIASRDDPFITLDRAAGYARSWTAGFRDIGSAGHINVASGYGPWPRGLGLLGDVSARIHARARRHQLARD